MSLHGEIELEMMWIACVKMCMFLHGEIELEMTWIACVKRLEVTGMAWLLVEDDVYVFAW
jgi:hypothetical protein